MVKNCTEPYPANSKYDEYFELYPYPLSDFQKYAIESIVDGNHVLVTAHTGSGKTLPAEFAIQHFVNQKKSGSRKKVIYTSPIKALSNQKFYEFTQKYPDISFGLFTGDIKTNPCADVIIMTTEILMNYLFTMQSNHDEIKPKDELQFQMDINTELAAVVFDEIHYINDEHRGHVWEQTILMLPRHIQMIMLSATIDNPVGFAQWCENRGLGDSSIPAIPAPQITDDFTQNKIVYLASTDKRVVPLTHYGYLTTTEGIFKGLKDKVLEKQIRDSTNELIPLQTAGGQFQDPGYNLIQKMQNVFDNRQIFMKRKFVLNQLTRFLKDREMLPAIAFVFSRKNVEQCAHEITTNLLEDDSKIPYVTRHDCDQIIRKFPNYHEYLELPEYNDLVSLLEKGIGIHHSGMLPILREIVEIMISKKRIKLLFATESFAIGLDCPIKTAIFTSLEKFDGSGLRPLMAHEYTQMAGRAGRRGIDTVGHVVHCNNLFFNPSIAQYKNILSGTPQKLVSKFKINYSTILNLLKTGFHNGFESFPQKSMLMNEVKKTSNTIRNEIVELEYKISKKTEMLEAMTVPRDICMNYMEKTNTLFMVPHKKRKIVEREIADMKDMYKRIETESVFFRDFDETKQSLNDKRNELDDLEQYMTIQVDKICDIMINEQFMEPYIDGVIDHIKEETKSYQLTSLGKMAMNVAEIHPLIISKLIEKWNYMANLSIPQIAGLLTCFTDIKVPDEQKVIIPKSNDVILKPYIETLETEYRRYESMELERGLYTGIEYTLMFDMVDDMMEWCDCKTDTDCKGFIQRMKSERGISIGDFSKAVMKIVTIARELSAMCTYSEQVDFQYKLKNLEPMVLKYITIAQSLYV